MKKVYIGAAFSSENKQRFFKEFEENYIFVDDIDKANIVIGEPDIDMIINSNIEWVQMTWAGCDKYTRNPGFPKNVILTNATGAFGVIISEYVIGSILNVYRHFREYYENQKAHIWADLGGENSLFGKYVIVLGVGDIGSNIAKRLKAFGCTVCGVRRNIELDIPEGFDDMRTLDTIEEQLPMADIVIGCMPNTDETIGFFNKERLMLLSPNSVLVNVGRGKLIVNKDLEETLKANRPGYFIMDVSETEPLSKDSLLWDMSNVMITPHISGPSFMHNKNTEERIYNICADNLNAYYEGRRLSNLVDLRSGYVSK